MRVLEWLQRACLGHLSIAFDKTVASPFESCLLLVGAMKIPVNLPVGK
jgi:hypothetical protein